MQDLEQTIRQCRQGDSLAWERLVKQYQGRVFALALHYLRDRDEAAEVSQEVFIKVYTAIADYRSDAGAFVPWLLSIVRNCCIDRSRKTGTRRRYEEAFRTQTDALSGAQSLTGDPEHITRSRQERSLLYRALDRLSGVNRDIVLLKDIQGLKNEEVAEILSLPVGTIKSRSFRARVKLSRMLTALKGEK